MHRSSSPLTKTLALALAAAIAAIAALALAAPARAERPGWYGNPSIQGAAPIEVGATLQADQGSVNCSPSCGPAGPQPERTGIFFEWVACTGTSGGGADRPTGGLQDDPRPCPGGVSRVAPSQTAKTYVVRAEDSGLFIQLHVVAANYDCGAVTSTGGQECRYVQGNGYSATVGPVGGGAPAVTVTGGAREGQTLTASGTTGVAYQWQRCDAAGQACVAIAGATAATYTLVADDVGSRVRVAVTRASRTTSSPPTNVVVGTPPTPTALPAVAGIAEDLQTLELSPGLWTGTQPITFTYRWLRCNTRLNGCAPIEGATGSTYRATRADIGSRLVAMVTATSRAGAREVAAPRTARVTAAKPRPGNNTLAVNEIEAPNALRLASVRFSSSRLPLAGRLAVSVQVKDRRGFLVDGARVEILAPRRTLLGTSRATTRRGVAVLRLRAGPRALSSEAIVVTVKVSNPGDPTLTTSKRFRLRVRPA